MKSSPESRLFSVGICMPVMVAVLVHDRTAHAQTTETWTGTSGGLWNVAGNWSGDVIPDNGVPTGSTYNVTINNGSAVNLNIGTTISNLTVGSGNSLAIGNGDALTIAGTSISNAGNLSVGSSGTTPYSSLAVPMSR